jgi:hypothetical protein
VADACTLTVSSRVGATAAYGATVGAGGAS